MAVLSVVFLDGERPGRQVVPYRTRLVVDRSTRAPSAPDRPGSVPRTQRGRRGRATAASQTVTAARAPMDGSGAGRRVGSAHRVRARGAGGVRRRTAGGHGGGGARCGGGGGGLGPA